MKKLFFFLAAICLCCLNSYTIYAGDGSICADAIRVDTAYGPMAIPQGDLWFTAETPALPMFVYWYPDEETTRAPQYALDFTCEYDENGKGVYADSIIADMISKAGNYHLSFPMNSELSKMTDKDGSVYYMAAFNEDYRDMLFQEGVTYAIPAYVRLRTFGSGRVRISSGSTWAQCLDYVNTLGMNTELLFEPEDSVNIYIWPLGEWSQLQYRITWEGESVADFYAGKNCMVSRTSLVRNYYVLPNNPIQMNPSRTDEWINDIYQTSLYVRLYAQKPGVLKINTYDAKPYVYEFIVMGIPAIIDQDAKTISAVLPYGTDAKTRLSAIQNAEVKYVSYNGEKPSYDRQGTSLTLGSVKYSLSIAPASDSNAANKSTNATLRSIVIDGDTLSSFAAGTLVYNDVEVTTEQPIVSASANDDKSAIKIDQAKSVPGTSTIVVTAEAGNTLTYTVNFINARSRNTELKSLLVDGEPLVGFSPDNRHYRMYALTVPVVEAVAADEKSSVVIDQAKSVPGFAQVFVTSEAGEVGTYTINFSIDPAILACTENSTPLTLNMPVAVSTSGEDVLRAPFGRGLDLDDSNWAGQRIAFRWSGDNDIIVYVGSSCLFDPAVKNKAFIDSVIISEPKGEERHIAYLTEKQTKEWGQRSIDGTLYLKVKTSKAGSLVAQTWTPNGNNNSTLIDINQEYYFPTGHTSDNLYKIYLPDWQKKKVKFSWEGMEKMTMYGAAKWEFRLTQSDPAMLRPDFPHPFSASDSWEWDEEGIEVLTGHNYMLGGGDFIYIRFITDGYAGTLTTEWAGGKPTRLDGVDMSNSTLTWTREGESIIIRSTIKQMVQVYTLQGMLVASEYITPDTPIILPCTSLPQGTTYIIRGEQQTGKIM